MKTKTITTTIKQTLKKLGFTKEICYFYKRSYILTNGLFYVVVVNNNLQFINKLDNDETTIKLSLDYKNLNNNNLKKIEGIFSQ